MRGPLVGRPGGLGGSGTLGAGNGYMGQSSRALFLPEPTRSCHCDLPVAKGNDTGTHGIAAHARQEKDSNAFSKLYKMSTDAKDTKLFNGDNKKDWKAVILMAFAGLIGLLGFAWLREAVQKWKGARKRGELRGGV